jgi:hypothetical protein
MRGAGSDGTRSDGKDDRPRRLRCSMTRIQRWSRRMVRHQHDATTEAYVEEVQRLLDGADDAVMQM